MSERSADDFRPTQDPRLRREFEIEWGGRRLAVRSLVPYTLRSGNWSDACRGCPETEGKLSAVNQRLLSDSHSEARVQGLRSRIGEITVTNLRLLENSRYQKIARLWGEASLHLETGSYRHRSSAQLRSAQARVERLEAQIPDYQANLRSIAHLETEIATVRRSTAGFAELNQYFLSHVCSER